jgi:serine/threonine-protein kinase
VAKGFTVRSEQAPDSLAPANTVARQDPVAGTPAPKGSQVTIFISGGGKQVPGVVNQSQAAATATLENDGFSVNAVMSAGPQGFPPGTVWKTSPSAGAILTQGSTVTIFVVPQPTPSPPSPSPSPSSPSPSSPPPST